MYRHQAKLEVRASRRPHTSWGDRPSESKQLHKSDLMLGANCKKPTHIPCAKILLHFPRLSISYWFPEMQRLEHLVLLQKTNENHVRTDVKG